MENYYAGIIQNNPKSEIDFIVEDFSINGFTLIHDFFSAEEMDLANEKILEIQNTQIKEIGLENLKAINEIDHVRNVCEYDQFFIDLINNENLLNIINAIIGQKYVLSLSNSNICLPNLKNYMIRWHRDFPYQNFLCDEVLGLNAFVAITEFTNENGGTFLLPFSNRYKNLPSDKFIKKNETQVICSAGSIIIFDSMLFHRAGINNTQNPRIGLNYNFVRPFIKQQYENTSGDDLNSFSYNLFGERYYSSKSATEYRKKKLGTL